MNIFVTSDDPAQCAAALDDKRVVKMALETTQLLCTAVNEAGGSTPYRSTHKAHPCTVWASSTRGNWQWTYELACALCAEYTARYGRRHACRVVLDGIADCAALIPGGQRTEFVNCARNAQLGIDYTDVDNVFVAYQLYLNARWDTDKRQPTWSNDESTRTKTKD